MSAEFECRYATEALLERLVSWSGLAFSGIVVTGSCIISTDVIIYHKLDNCFQ